MVDMQIKHLTWANNEDIVKKGLLKRNEIFFYFFII